MAMVNIKLPSGWVPIEESIEKLKSSVDLKRFEINENLIVLYFNEVTIYLNFSLIVDPFLVYEIF